jgi:CRISPR/Cas system-associated exonuclease Cas4 (RecB family)
MKFEELIDKMIENFLDEEIKDRKENVFYPSELPFCIRKNYLMHIKPKKYGIAKLKLFEAGNIVHNFFREVIFKSYMTTDLIKDFDYEGSLTFKGDEFEIHGRFDDLIIIEWEEKPMMLEVKTVKDFKFFKEAKDYHKEQLNFYLTIKKLDKGYIIYIDRGNLQHKIFEIKQSDALFNTTVKRATELYKHLKEKKIPLAEAKLDKDKKWMCNYCLYRLECLKVE